MESAQIKVECVGWNPALPGQAVRLRDNPGRRGTTTGKMKTVGNFVMAEVDFGPNDRAFKRVDLLEPVDAVEDLFDVLAGGRFGGPIDLRRILVFEKIKGDLTNIFYSMESSNTDFYPHQFKPVLKFIESPIGRLLIADEVGLGKTIEAVYIWKELQARADARRLLIVCPAMLREKWRRDLQVRFNISADISSAGDVLRRIREFAERGLNANFVLITSLEGLRPPASFEDYRVSGIRAEFARLLDANMAAEDWSLFDLVIIDEAHYLRNSLTANHRLGRLLRDASRHLLLLTATPIQIASDNLLQLLKLIEPEQFHDVQVFDEMLHANAPVVRALRHVWSQPSDIAAAREAVEEAAQNVYFENDAVLGRVRAQLAAPASPDAATRVEIARLLDGRSLLGQYMTRSRKREVLENRVERGAQVLQVYFQDEEREVYDRITRVLRERASEAGGVSIFALIARQRQMASCIVAALEGWRDKDLLEEYLWEDLGRVVAQDQQIDDAADDPSVDSILVTALAAADDTLPADRNVDLARLEAVDSKFNELRKFLKSQLGQNPREKVVIFAFYRNTLKYLDRRLRAEGISTALIMGGMGEERNALIDAFQRPDGPSILLSSEVGSEGIDLQFCRILVNYDLPWNPMRVEQRIGRLDRLGQQAERVSIINLKLEDTIEDRIIMRLYDRIALFRDSIGDLEEILGEVTERLMLDLLKPDLTDAERERRAEQTAQAILMRRAEQDRLEREAVNLVAFSDFILDSIRDSRDKGRWLSGDEIRSLIDDFFARRFPGTEIEPHANLSAAARIRLSDVARTSLGAFVAAARPATGTMLHRTTSPVLCVFDPRRGSDFGRGVELVEPTHPLVQWIRAEYIRDGRQLHPAAAVRLPASEAPVPPGDYAFLVHRWSLSGLRTEHVLSFRAAAVSSEEVLDAATSEALVTAASRAGLSFPNATNVIGSLDAILSATAACDEVLNATFAQRMSNFEAENRMRCDQQETSARRFAERRIAGLQERLQRFRAEGRLRLIPMTEGLLRKEETDLKAKLARIASRRITDPTLVPLAAGVIRVG